MQLIWNIPIRKNIVFVKAGKCCQHLFVFNYLIIQKEIWDFLQGCRTVLRRKYLMKNILYINMKFFCFCKELKFPFEDLSGDYNILYNDVMVVKKFWCHFLFLFLVFPMILVHHLVLFKFRKAIWANANSKKKINVMFP